MDIAALIVAIVGVSLQAIGLAATSKKAVEGTPQPRIGKVRQELRQIADRTIQSCLDLRSQVSEFKRALVKEGVDLNRRATDIERDPVWITEKSGRKVRDFGAAFSAIETQFALMNNDVRAVLDCLGDTENRIAAEIEADGLRRPLASINFQDMTLREIFDALEEALGNLADYLTPGTQTFP